MNTKSKTYSFFLYFCLKLKPNDTLKSSAVLPAAPNKQKHKNQITMKKFRSFCPVARGLDLFGDKWTLLIMRDIGNLGKSTYKELAAMPEKIATNTLAERLERLVGEGILTKTRSTRNKLVFIYAITEKGKELLPVIDSLTEWSSKYLYNNEDDHKKTGIKNRIYC